MSQVFERIDEEVVGVGPHSSTQQIGEALAQTDRCFCANLNAGLQKGFSQLFTAVADGQTCQRRPDAENLCQRRSAGTAQLSQFGAFGGAIQNLVSSVLGAGAPLLRLVVGGKVSLPAPALRLRRVNNNVKHRLWCDSIVANLQRGRRRRASSQSIHNVWIGHHKECFSVAISQKRRESVLLPIPPSP